MLTNKWSLGAYYNPTDEPDLGAPYLYAYLGQPWKTPIVVRAAESLYNTTPTGIPGNDDLGEMSAWYVMSALGIYPYAAGSPNYVLTAPLLPSGCDSPEHRLYNRQARSRLRRLARMPTLNTSSR